MNNMRDIIKEVLDRFIAEETDYNSQYIDENGFCSDELFGYLIQLLPQQSMPSVTRGSEDGVVDFEDIDGVDEESPIGEFLIDNAISIHYYYEADYDYGDNGVDIYHDFGYTLRNVNFFVEYLSINDERVNLTDTQCEEIEDYLNNNYIDESSSYDGSDEYDPSDDAYDEMRDWD